MKIYKLELGTYPFILVVIVAESKQAALEIAISEHAEFSNFKESDMFEFDTTIPGILIDEILD